MKHRYNVLLLALGVFLSATPPVFNHGDQKATAELRGELVVQYGDNVNIPGQAGRTVPRKDFPVYLFEWKRSAPLRQWLQKLDQDIGAANKNPGDSDKQWIVEKRREDAYREIIQAVTARRTKTDANGRFVFDELEPGSKYLVIAVDDVYELGIILLYEAVGPLKPGKNEIRLVDRIG